MQSREVIDYSGSPIEKLNTRTLVFPENHQKENRFFIPDDVVVGQYGVIGFLVIDNKPEQRWVSYADGGWTGVKFRESDITSGSHADRKSHFLNTDRGFKMIRYFILPPKVAQFFERDNFLGGPMIEKCCREATLPEEFDEVPAIPQWSFGSGQYVSGAEELIKAVIKAAFPHLSEEEILKYKFGKDQYAYLSFHPWQEFKSVIQEGQESIFASINNFDNTLGRFDTKQNLLKRDLRITYGNSSLPELGK